MTIRRRLHDRHGRGRRRKTNKVMAYQAEIWSAITAGAIVGAIAGGAIVYLCKVKKAHEAKRG